MRVVRFTPWLSSLILLLFFVALPPHSSLGSPLPAPPPPSPEERQLLPYREMPAGTATLPPQAESMAPYMDWSAGVYQAVVDNNWEIYLMNNSQEVRLTYHGAMDIEPRLNRGATKIVFASNRSGDFYQIFTMNLDGTGVTRLTSTNADNGNPAWSPDGSKIAFESYRDGQAEIYVMDANGANQRRLTWADGPDTTPVWSPDGTQIAFSSARTGGYRIWVMQADGNQAHQMTTQPYSFYPAWSPDGRWIAYSCDSNGDGWLEAWVIESNGASNGVVYSAQRYSYTTKDVWVRSWTPDGKRVALTQVDLVYYEEEWYWTRAWLLTAIHGDATTLSNTKVGWNPDLQTKDILPPIATMFPLPDYLPAGMLQIRSATVQESGAPGTVSGGNYLELQYRTGADNWQSTLTSWLFPEIVGSVNGFAGNTMSFRLRAIDYAGNQSEWYPNDAGMATTFYERQIDGQVLDMRRMPNHGASITTNPQTLGAHTTDSLGRYTQYTVAPEAHVLTATQTGYGALPPVYTNLTEDSPGGDNTIVHVLQPRQNLIANGNFEAPLTSTWGVSGTVIPQARAAHSGQKGLRMTQSGSITQTVTLPPEIHAPTLSFLLHIGGSTTSPQDSFEVAVQDAVTTTTLLELNASTGLTPTLAGGWEHLWFDMDAWRGQTITLTFTLVDAPDGASVQVYLDEVALGAWESPSVTAVTPGKIDVATTAPITITGSNFVPTPTVRFGVTPAETVQWLDAQTLRVTPPMTLPHGVHDVVVSNPGGASGTLLGGLRVGQQLMLPVIWKTFRAW